MTEPENDPFAGINDLNGDDQHHTDTTLNDDVVHDAAPQETKAAESVVVAPIARGPQHYLVRIKPYSKKRGNLVRVFTLRGTKFKEGDGWYKVNPQMASYLRNVTIDGDPDSREVFDVCTEDQAKDIAARELKASTAASPYAPHTPDRARSERDVRTRHDPTEGVLTTRDLPRHRSMAAGEG